MVYDFHLTRGQSVVEEFLENFEGEVLLVDGYAGYNPCKERGVKRAGCLAHARRYVRAAILYSLIETCKRMDIDPFAYLRDVLARVTTHPARRVDELTPAAWKSAREPVAAATLPTSD